MHENNVNVTGEKKKKMDFSYSIYQCNALLATQIFFHELHYLLIMKTNS